MSNKAATHDELSDLTERIIACIINVHSTLGPGFLEGIYHRALMIELKNNGIPAESEKAVSVYYEGEEVGLHRLDILVDDKVILELKTVEQLNRAHYGQLRSYLKATGLKVGLLVNFSKERADFRRIEM